MLIKVVERNPMIAWITERKRIQDRCRAIVEPSPVAILCAFCTQSTEARFQFSVESLRLEVSHLIVAESIDFVSTYT